MKNRRIASSVSLRTGLGSALGLHNLQIVRPTEYPGDSIRTEAGHILVRLVVDDAFEANVTAFDDDANRFLHAEGVFLESWEAVNRTVQANAETIVHGRRRKNLDLVVDVFDAFYVLDGIFGFRLQRRPDYLT